MASRGPHPERHLICPISSRPTARAVPERVPGYNSAIPRHPWNPTRFPIHQFVHPEPARTRSPFHLPLRLRPNGRGSDRLVTCPQQYLLYQRDCNSFVYSSIFTGFCRRELSFEVLLLNEHMQKETNALFCCCSHTSLTHID